MPAQDLDIKSVRTFLSGLGDKLAELGRHL
jgi:hypothetical protein